MLLHSELVKQFKGNCLGVDIVKFKVKFIVSSNIFISLIKWKEL